MTTTIPKFSPGEAVTEKDGLIHGVSAQELQVLGEQCFEARGKAYCMYLFISIS
jgi:cytidine deaminase